MMSKPVCASGGSPSATGLSAPPPLLPWPLLPWRVPWMVSWTLPWAPWTVPGKLASRVLPPWAAHGKSPSRSSLHIPSVLAPCFIFLRLHPRTTIPLAAAPAIHDIAPCAVPGRLIRPPAEGGGGLGARKRVWARVARRGCGCGALNSMGNTC